MEATGPATDRSLSFVFFGFLFLIYHPQIVPNLKSERVLRKKPHSAVNCGAWMVGAACTGGSHFHQALTLFVSFSKGAAQIQALPD